MAYVQPGTVIRTRGTFWGGVAGAVLLGVPATVYFASQPDGVSARTGRVVVGVLVIVMFLSFAAQCVRVGPSGLVLQNWYRTPEFHPYTQIGRIILKRRGYLLVARVELETGELRSARAITYPGAWMSLERVRELIRELNDVVERAKAEPDATLR